jgi:FixJ family two-component response regulator
LIFRFNVGATETNGDGLEWCSMLIGVIDDDVRMLESIGEWLAATGYEAHLFETAEALLRDEACEVLHVLLRMWDCLGLAVLN